VTRCSKCDGCTCTEPLHHSPYGHCLLGCNQTLTFAKAMALDPSEVEVDRHADGDWKPLSDWLGISLLAGMRTCYFRRARPKRSRVQEMAETAANITGDLSTERHAAMIQAIRAVCEYLNRNCYGDCNIEREFLEPR